MDAPIFLFCNSARSGSTWIARLLTSTKEVLIWGEPNVFRARQDYLMKQPWTNEENIGSTTDLHAFREHKDKIWSAKLLPLSSDLDHGWFNLMQIVFGESAKREGYKNWGIKEIYWTIDDVEFIKKFWPKAKIIYLVRKFDDCYMSACGTGWLNASAGKVDFIEKWIACSRCIVNINRGDNELLLQYERAIENHEEVIKWCGLSEAKIPLDYISKTSRLLTAHESSFLEPYKNQIRELTALLGYQL
jgi:hypothetical protein